jgi:hypothetical protein
MASAVVTVMSATGPTLVQYKQAVFGNSSTSGTLSFDNPIKQGNVIWAVVTIDNQSGTPNVKITDSAKNVFMQLDQKNDVPGEQSLIHDWAHIAANDGATPDSVTVTWTVESFKALLIAEVSGVSAAPLVGTSANIQDMLGVGTNLATSGAVTVSAAQVPALMIAVSANVSNASGGGAPSVGTGYMGVGGIWEFNGTSPFATLETLTLTSAMTLPALFSPVSMDDYLTVMAVFH